MDNHKTIDVIVNGRLVTFRRSAGWKTGIAIYECPLGAGWSGKLVAADGVSFEFTIKRLCMPTAPDFLAVSGRYGSAQEAVDGLFGLMDAARGIGA